MKVIRTIPEMREARQAMSGPAGFVPTMGYLHEGHLSLVQGSKRDNSSTVVSIFVNPTQFGPKDDFNRYPRDERRDISMLEKAGVDVVFLPTAVDMYPSGFNTWVDVLGITERLEGLARPGHFRGVATICNKLFNIVLPDRVYFGQKDAQQLAVGAPPTFLPQSHVHESDSEEDLVVERVLWRKGIRPAQVRRGRLQSHEK